MNGIRITQLALAIVVALALHNTPAHAQAALLMEEPYGFFGKVNPTGHNALYFARICADTPVKLRRCEAGELGAVIARYQGISGYDWVAIPLVPYLYSVENASSVPAHADRTTVTRMRNRYHEAHLLSLGEDLPAGGLTRGGWTELIGAAYERRIYAFRFNTTEEQDDALIARMNAGENISHFGLFYNNCADFSRLVLNSYFPGTFRRSIFPDADMTTPKQTTYKLTRYARRHPETQLAIFEIPQIPGYRRHSRPNHGVAESLATTGYAIPILLVNPYIAGGLLADYLVRGHFRFIPRHPSLLTPETLGLLGQPAQPGQPLSPASILAEQNSGSDASQPLDSARIGSDRDNATESRQPEAVDFDLKGTKDAHE